MTNTFLSISDAGIISCLGVRLGMSEEEIFRANKNLQLTYRKTEIAEIFNKVILTGQYKLDGYPICSISFYVKKDGNLSWMLLNFSCKSNDEAEKTFQNLLDQATRLGLHQKTWKKIKEKEDRRILYNWAQSINISIKKSEDNKAQAYPVSFSIIANDAATMLAEIGRISRFIEAVKQDKETPEQKTTWKEKAMKFLKKPVTWISSLVLLAALICFLVWPKQTEPAPASLYSPTINNNKVYICTSANSKKYHRTPDCRWLENCSESIQDVTVDEAKAVNKTPCKSCYQ